MSVYLQGQGIKERITRWVKTPKTVYIGILERQGWTWELGKYMWGGRERESMIIFFHKTFPDKESAKQGKIELERAVHSHRLALLWDVIRIDE